jgi:hypothetical protein
MGAMKTIKYAGRKRVGPAAARLGVPALAGGEMGDRLKAGLRTERPQPRRRGFHPCHLPNRNRDGKIFAKWSDSDRVQGMERIDGVLPG